jgi:G:T/U-mismatch repair DNA glycosylase
LADTATSRRQNGEAAADLAALTERPGPGAHRTKVDVAGRRLVTLADLPPLRNRLLFVGVNPSAESAAAGHYHQDEVGQAFWRRLMTARILPAKTAVETADDALLEQGHGITDLVKRPTDTGDVSDDELRGGVGVLWQKIAIWRPAATVFIHRRAASAAAGRTLKEPWGQLDGVALAGRPCFLMPDPFAPPEQVDEGLNFIRNLGASLPDQD